MTTRSNVECEWVYRGGVPSKLIVWSTHLELPARRTMTGTKVDAEGIIHRLALALLANHIRLSANGDFQRVAEHSFLALELEGHQDTAIIVVVGAGASNDGGAAARLKRGLRNPDKYLNRELGRFGDPLSPES